MKAEYIFCLNIQTAVAKDFRPTDTTSGAIAELVPVIERAIDAGQQRPVIAGSLPHGWLTIDDKATARAMRATIWLGARGRRQPVLAVVYCERLRSPAGAKLYRELLADAQVPVHPAAREQPQAPWIAVRPEPAFADLPTDLVAAYEAFPVTLARAWIEYHKPTTTAHGSISIIATAAPSARTSRQAAGAPAARCHPVPATQASAARWPDTAAPGSSEAGLAH